MISLTDMIESCHESKFNLLYNTIIFSPKTGNTINVSSQSVQLSKNPNINIPTNDYHILYIINYTSVRPVHNKTKMWENMIEYLKDPLLVVKVQNFFGVIYNKRSVRDNESEVIQSDRLEREKDNFDLTHKRIPSNTSTSSSSYDTDTSAEVEEVEFHIDNKFWYYLFVVGTALGDEIFYATFIPFWFWNIDGAVGRRVVLVWTIVMYIGNFF